MLIAYDHKWLAVVVRECRTAEVCARSHVRDIERPLH